MSQIKRRVKKLKCPSCRSVRLRKDGIVKGKQRYFCKRCGHRTIVPKGRT